MKQQAKRSLNVAANEFLACRKFAVAGVSRSGNAVGNTVYKKLKAQGYEVFAVNPHAEAIEGDACYADLASIPDGVDVVFVATKPEISASVVRECARLGIERVWLHRSFGQGSYSDEAVEVARDSGIQIIPGSCPMMHCQPVDVGHKCIRWVLGVTGKLPS
ncbi:CoA-binding protein [Bacteroidota bacterium]